ncbi:AraC family transcriptional regulator [Chitinophaga sp.]|uniref:helix-turn-helix transcriptional regulator n=1 Tax=Chitinophaga sp. TaxID=1869181 RepID=UPI0031D6EEF3
MNADNYFITRKPENQFLSTLVDHYFHIDVSVNQLPISQEFIIPCPRITFGYFFNHPFIATNHSLKQSVPVHMVISRIRTQKITVQPQTDKIKIIGAHLRPFCLAYLTRQPIHTMPWLINAVDLFKETATEFCERIDNSSNVEQMFNEVEKFFLDNILIRDLSVISNAIELIEKSAGNIQIGDIARQLGVSDRTIRGHFYDHVGCTPKEYIRVVKLKQVAFQLRHSDDSLTDIAYDNNYFDQAHFTHDVKSITGRSPNELRKQMPNFRFLQF